MDTSANAIRRKGPEMLADSVIASTNFGLAERHINSSRTHHMVKTTRDRKLSKLKIENCQSRSTSQRNFKFRRYAKAGLFNALYIRGRC